MDKSNRSSKYSEGQKVNLVILRETDLGFVAKINDDEEGLLYHSEIFENLKKGQELPGYIKKIREDGRIDLILQPFGNFGTSELANQILEIIKENNGFMAINDKTEAETIYNLFGVSKKKFKMAIGLLYKQRRITISTDGIRLLRI